MLTPAKRKTLVISVKTIFLLLVESISVSSSYGERNILREVPFPSWVPALLQGQMNMLEFIVTTASANYAALSHGRGENLPEPRWEGALGRRQNAARERQTPMGREVEIACSRADGGHQGSFGGSLKTTRLYKVMARPNKGSADGLTCERGLPVLPVL